MRHYMTVAEVARLAGKSRQLVDMWVREGRLRAEWAGPVRVMDRGEVEEILRVPRPLGRPVEREF